MILVFFIISDCENDGENDDSDYSDYIDHKEPGKCGVD